MKIGILTHELGNNYGGLLQNYAMQQVLKSMGHSPITLDHQTPNPYTLPIKIASLLKQSIRKIIGVHENLRVWTTNKEKVYISHRINKFIQNHLERTNPFRQSELRTRTPDDLDAIVVGSDQVWNPTYIKPIDRFFLSDFVDKDILRIAYAASFGGNQWMFNEQETAKCKELIHKFDLITVREDSGVAMCKEYLHVDATHVLDPTMLLSHDHYCSLLPASRSHKKNSLMVYILDKTYQKNKLVEEIAINLGLEINSIMPESSFRKEGPIGIEKCVFPAVETWIQGFEDADFVVTDSFHGTVFAIIFNKPFITIINRERGADRFISLLKLFGLEDRLVDINDDYISLLGKNIDFEYVNTILDYNRNISISALEKFL